jgi:hypothetical protein
MPFYLSYPLHYKEQVEVNMPEEWSAESFDKTVECPGFRLKALASASGRKILLNYEYETLKNHIEPGEAGNFFTNFDLAYSAIAYDITYKSGETISFYNASTSTASTSSSVFPKLYLLLGTCVLITFLVRGNKQKQY